MSRTIATGLLILFALLAPALAPQDPHSTRAESQLQAPSSAHWLGTDLLGRDVFSRFLYGGQRILLIASAATILGVVPGVLLGLTAAFGHRRIDGLINGLLDALLAFPGVIFALLLLTLLGSGTPLTVAVATGAMQIAPCARVTRAAAISVRSSGYIEAAVGCGAARAQIIRAHVLPNIAFTLLAYIVVMFSFNILNSAALTFLGLGGAPGTPDWGVMLAEGRSVFRAAPWVALAPGIGISVVVIVINWLAHSVAESGTARAT
jgi:ABC-type dipeptide/oligopeptide/nickel transport system permease subunit